MALKIYQAAKKNSSIDFFVRNTFINVLEKSNEHHRILDTVLDDSMIEIHKMKEKDDAKIKATDWRSILMTLCKKRREKNVEKIIDIIQKYSIELDNQVYNLLLTICVNKGWIELGKRIHTHIEQNGKMNIILKCLINMYGKCGCSEEAIETFNKTKVSDRNDITWSTMILAYGQYGEWKEVLALFDQMENEGILPDKTTITRVSNACSHSGLVQEAFDIFYNLKDRFNDEPNAFHCTCIVDVLGRAGRLEDAENFIVGCMNKHQIKPSAII